MIENLAEGQPFQILPVLKTRGREGGEKKEKQIVPTKQIDEFIFLGGGGGMGMREGYGMGGGAF